MHAVSARNLEVIFYDKFNFREYISKICRTCYYHIRDLRRIRRHLPLFIVETISSALVTSRLDYCNLILFDIILSLRILQNYIVFRIA